MSKAKEIYEAIMNDDFVTAQELVESDLGERKDEAVKEATSALYSTITFAVESEGE